MKKIASILSTGEELLLGEILDTNAPFLCGELFRLGYRVQQIVTIGDNRCALTQALRDLSSKSDLLILTGGLGPTPDDHTREALAELVGMPLEEREELLEEIQARFQAMGRPMAESNRLQARLPRGAEPIRNLWGTAPGIFLRYRGCEIYALPGVPSEMRAIFSSFLLPRLQEHLLKPPHVRRLHFFGIGESSIGEVLGEIEAQFPTVNLGTTVSDGVVTVRLLQEEGEEGLVQIESIFRKRFPEYLFGTDGETLPEVVVHRLTERGETLALAESCTGGMIASLLVDVPGASRVLIEGTVAYANEAKIRRLGVSPQLLKRYGAVSSEVAMTMARQCQQHAHSTYGLAVTGIAGSWIASSSEEGDSFPCKREEPSCGETHEKGEKPVGTVWFALIGPFGEITFRRRFLSDRNRNRFRAAQTALDLLRRAALGLPFFPSDVFSPSNP